MKTGNAPLQAAEREPFGRQILERFVVAMYAGHVLEPIPGGRALAADQSAQPPLTNDGTAVRLHRLVTARLGHLLLELRSVQAGHEVALRHAQCQALSQQELVSVTCPGLPAM